MLRYWTGLTETSQIYTQQLMSIFATDNVDFLNHLQDRAFVYCTKDNIAQSPLKKKKWPSEDKFLKRWYS